MHQSPTSGNLQTGSEETAKPASTASSTRPRRTPSKPQSQVSNGPVDTSPRPKGSEAKRAKPTFTTCLSFPEAAPLPTPLPVVEAEGGKSQRRSKVEALTKIDRAVTPLAAASGPAATSFIPAPTVPTPAVSGPSVSRNPLHHPPVINPPFDIGSVRTSAPRHPPSRSGSRLFGLQECPVYYPTAEQFKDCMGYIDSIAQEAKAFGICKIVPPEGWRMPFVLETDKFRFKTRLQRLNSLEAASRAKINFLEQLQTYYEQADNKLHIPIIDRRPVDLYGLRKAVNKIGGKEEVDRMKGWGVIAKTLGYDEKFSHTIRSTYNRIILPFDTFANGRKSASGSPLTPMPSTTASKPPGFAQESPASPTLRGRMSGIRPPRSFDSQRGQSSKSASPPAKPLSLPLGPLRDASPSDHLARSGSAASSLTTIKIKVPGFTSRDGSESELSDEDPPPKRRMVEEPTRYQKGEVCEVCQRGDDGTKILLCDSCDKGFHTYCLNPPLTFVPTNEEWYCGPCLFAQGDDYGFDEGEDHSITSFQARDKAFAQYWWSKHPTSSQVSGTSRDLGGMTVSEDDVEREFWRLTEDTNDTVEIEYGADVHSTTHGSGSPSPETHPLEPYSRDGWNLNNMPILQESLLRYIRSDISGMTVPWIYVGMMLSAFCWHNEDHYTYSVNYMHWGETKTWYGIPGSDAELFEEAMKSEAPELFEQQPSLLYQLVTMMNPGRVSAAGVKVVACDQRPNEFVITFPKAYHCGFNHGINFNEAVNFALPDWLPDGKEAVLRYKQHAKAPVFSHNELLINITLYSDTIRTAIWLNGALKEMIDEETARRDRLRNAVPMLTEQLVEEDGPEEQYQCCICKGFCYLSQVICACTKLVTCVEHADQLCKCAPNKRTLRKRYSEAQLEEILAVVQNRALQPENWRLRLDNVLEVARPPLKSMRALLADGERIAHQMPEVHELRAIVTRANAWVERFTTLATRKSTGRKKRRQTGPEDDQDRNPETLERLMQEARQLAFDAPEIIQLRQMLLSIESFKLEANAILSASEEDLDMEKCETALILGTSLNLDLPEVPKLQNIVNRLQWFKKVGTEVDDRTMQYEDVVALLQSAEEYSIPTEHEFVVELREREAKGHAWLDKVNRLFASKEIRVEDISALIKESEFTPISVSTMQELEGMRKQIIAWQTTAQHQLEGTGSTMAAQRLCKAVKSAAGHLRKVHIPEVDTVQRELDFHAKWTEGISRTIGVPPAKVSGFLNNLLAAVQRNLAPEDLYPNAEHTCFCRGSPAGVMVKCQTCQVDYHPKCVKITPANVDKPFRCAMCAKSSYDDRPSLSALSYHSVLERYNFAMTPKDMETLMKIVETAIQFIRQILPVVDPLDTAVQCKDFDLLAHWHRKLFNLPVTFDAYNDSAKCRVVFEEWLWKRMVEAKKPVKAQPRQRKPKLVLRQSKPGMFGCICSTPPLDATAIVECFRCQQSYHASCVKAPAECTGPDKVNWRCPCCTVRDARRYQQGNVVVRVQNSDRLGTDEFIDYRTTINSFSTSILEYRLPLVDCILLECIGFVKPVIPEGFTPPSIEEVRATRFDDNNDDIETRPGKRQKTESGPRTSILANGSNGSNGSSAPPVHGANGAHVPNVNGHGAVPISSYRPAASPAAQSTTTPIIAPNRLLDLPSTPSAAPSGPVRPGNTYGSAIVSSYMPPQPPNAYVRPPSSNSSSMPSPLPPAAATATPAPVLKPFPSVFGGPPMPKSITVNQPPTSSWFPSLPREATKTEPVASTEPVSSAPVDKWRPPVASSPVTAPQQRSNGSNEPSRPPASSSSIASIMARHPH